MIQSTMTERTTVPNAMEVAWLGVGQALIFFFEGLHPDRFSTGSTRTAFALSS